MKIFKGYVKNTDTAAPARGASHAARGAARRRRVSWKGLNLLHLFLNLSTPRRAVVCVQSVCPSTHPHAHR